MAPAAWLMCNMVESRIMPSSSVTALGALHAWALRVTEQKRAGLCPPVLLFADSSAAALHCRSLKGSDGAGGRRPLGKHGSRMLSSTAASQNTWLLLIASTSKNTVHVCLARR
eukprot:TRINITY_DN31603_c0_g1_i1.p2 TRINITY_DN31603_c0_g1~~TRINITY_DN31603_c0_g1_i1.p2  ORF type:complete len:113 (-),score=11.13 TRINITY_DN31603_c0_g1_i1:96-434(-)